MLKSRMMLEHLKSPKNIMLLLAITIALSVTGTLSFLRTEWETFQLDFFFWWSIISSIIGLAFLVISIWQYWESKSQSEKNKAQVKVWMQDSNGIREALRRIVRDNIDGRYSSTNDMGNAVWSVEASAFSLYQSLYEERCVTEEEYRTRQKKLAEVLEKRQLADLENEVNQKTATS